MALKQKILITATDNTKSAFRSIGTSLTSLTKSVFSLKSAFVLAAGAAGLGLLVSKSLKAIDNIGKMSKIFGIAAEDLAAFDLAAQIGGTNLETFAKAARNVAKNVFEFLTKGTGEALDAFKALGVTQEDLIPIMNDQIAIFSLFADKLKDIPDGLAKTAIAYDLFGGRAIALLPAIADGSEGFRKFKEEVELFGTALSGQAVAGVEQLNDDMVRLQFVAKGLSQQIVSSLAPALNLVVDNMLDWAIIHAQAKGGIEALAKTISVNIIGSFENLVIGSIELINKFRQAKADTANLKIALIDLNPILQFQIGTFKILANAVSFWSKALIDATNDASPDALVPDLIDTEKFKKIFADLKLAIITVVPEVQTLSAVTGTMFDLYDSGAKDAAKALKEQEKALEKVRLEAEKLIKQIGDEGVRLTRTLRTEMEVYNDSLKRNDELLKAGAISAVTWGRANASALELLKKAQEEANEVGDAAKDMGLTFQSAFEAAIIEGNNLRAVLVGMLDDIAKIILRQSIIEPVGNFISGIVSGILGGGSVGKIFGTQSTPGKAHGGPVAGGKTVLVGERGPELFVPGASGKIIPNNKLGGGGGDVNISITVNSETGGVTEQGNVSNSTGFELARRIQFLISSEIERQKRPGGLINQ